MRACALGERKAGKLTATYSWRDEGILQLGFWKKRAKNLCIMGTWQEILHNESKGWKEIWTEDNWKSRSSAGDMTDGGWRRKRDVSYLMQPSTERQGKLWDVPAHPQPFWGLPYAHAQIFPPAELLTAQLCTPSKLVKPCTTVECHSLVSSGEKQYRGRRRSNDITVWMGSPRAVTHPALLHLTRPSWAAFPAVTHGSLQCVAMADFTIKNKYSLCCSWCYKNKWRYFA